MSGLKSAAIVLLFLPLDFVSALSLRDVVEEVKSLSRVVTGGGTPRSSKFDHHGGDSQSEDAPTKTSLKIIGAGLGRTGTASLAMALRRLGYQTYHMEEIALGGYAPVWAEYARAKMLLQKGESGGSDSGVDSDALHVLSEAVIKKRRATIDIMSHHGYNATTDFPACLIFEELMLDYPDAKVVLSVRSSGDVWATSVLKTIGRVPSSIAKRPWRWIPQFQPFTHIIPFLWAEIGALDTSDFEASIDTGKEPKFDQLARAYDEWADHVKSTVPPDRLLVHQSEDGYGPLCSFLGVLDCPSASGENYPRKNESREIQRTCDAMNVISQCFDVGVLLTLIVIYVWLVMKRGRHPFGKHAEEQSNKKSV